MSDRGPGRRWRDGAGATLANQVLDRLSSGQRLDDLPLESHGGRTDLRGFVLPEPSTLGEATVVEARDGADTSGPMVRRLGDLVELRDVELSDLDFTSARLDHLRLFNVRLRNCVFDRVRGRDWRFWDVDARDCGFTGADLRDAALGTWGNRYTNVEFRDADLRGATCRGATFVDCDFARARLDGVEFVGCRLVRCGFAGLLDEVGFLAAPDKPDPGALEDVSFAEATLRWVTFRGLSLESVRLPREDADHVIVRHYPCVVRKSVSRLDGDLDAKTRRLRSRLRAAASQLDEDRDIGLFHRDELGETEEQQRFAREFLHEVEQECAAKA